MKPAPQGWPRLSSALFYDDANAAIAWLCKAFGFEVRLKVDAEDGSVIHSELLFGEAVVMVGPSSRDKRFASPTSVGGMNTQTLMLYVDDVAAHCERARAAGARILSEPKVTDYGEGYWADRHYGVEDLGGHLWYFAQRVRG